MAPSRATYELETRAHKAGYEKKDVWGEVPAEKWRDGVDGGQGGKEGKGGKGAKGAKGEKGEKGEKGAPGVLRPGWNGSDVCWRWRGKLGMGKEPEGVGQRKAMGEEKRKEEGKGEEEVVVRMSEDAGRYLCEFVFYASMLEWWLADKGKGAEEGGHVAFLHVPGGVEEEDVQRGVRVAVAAIEAILESLGESERKGGKRLDSGERGGRET